MTSVQVLVTVNWSPEMVADVEKNQLQSVTALNKLLSSGATSITMNYRSITLKPTYLWLNPALLVQGRYYQMSTWPGPPEPAAPFPSNRWQQCVWLDSKDATAGSGTGAVDTTCAADGSSRTSQTTYGLAHFIHFKVIAASNVATLEMTEWTWQTFWWQPDAANPPAPSSAAIAATRPRQLKGAPRHYAQCSDYQMVDPNQPITGGHGAKPVFCYNPYLEAPFFGPQELPDSRPWTYQGTTYLENAGVTSNCMSCHVQAAYPQDNTAPGFTGDQYIDLNGAPFARHLKMDSAWTIVENVK
jgi:hypothetical protein